MEQSGDGGGTVLLESYKSTCDETVPLPLSPSAAAKEERDSVEQKEEERLTAAQCEEVKKEEGKCLIHYSVLSLNGMDLMYRLMICQAYT